MFCRLILKTALATTMAATLVMLKMDKVPCALQRTVNKMVFHSAHPGWSQVNRKRSRAASNGMTDATLAALTRIELLMRAQKWAVRPWNDHIAPIHCKNSQKIKLKNQEPCWPNLFLLLLQSPFFTFES